MQLSCIIKELIDYIEDTAELPFYIDIDSINGEEGACIRADASPYAETKYIDGTADKCFNFSLWCRMQEAEECRNVCEEILERVHSLEGSVFSTQGGDLYLECVTTPQFIEREEKATTYMATFKAKVSEGERG